jgi:subtilase family serine protease
MVPCRALRMVAILNVSRNNLEFSIERDDFMIHRPVFCAFFAAILAAGTLLASPAAANTSAFSAIPGSARPVAGVSLGDFRSARMTVEVVLIPRNQPQMDALLTRVSNPNGSAYQQWLPKGRFNALFAPSSAESAAVASYLRANGLSVQQSSSPFLLRAVGSSSAVANAFRTSLRTYRSRSGITYFSNVSAVQLPAALAPGILGVIGLSSTVRMQPQIKHSMSARQRGSPAVVSCEAPYPTVAQLFGYYVNGINFPFGYGGGPGCNGLSPSQINSMYGAPNLGARAQGAGANLAVFELAGYQHSDIVAWTTQFYGAGYTPPLVDINVDGGPLDPVCPSGDTCASGYSGDAEVDADIQMQLAVSPAAQHILVYNAPNDDTGQTSLDELVQIASDDTADVVSSSWSVCENDAGAAYAEAENTTFEQMALQGQSMFGAEGDTGAFSCIRSDGSTGLAVLDPPAQPWVTSVGGTSFETFNPDTIANPSYPAGIESVWNTGDLCNQSANEDGFPGTAWCGATGAGGGGNSQFWGAPLYQHTPGIANAYTTYGNGTTQCVLAANGTQCRSVPDVSANADEYTPYAEYCTANAGTPGSDCGFTANQTPPGWFGDGGTSLSSPIWSAIIADRDSFNGHRTGNANNLLYILFHLNAHAYFHDITGVAQSTNNNGFFPTTPGYDLATGLGTPKMRNIITGEMY